MGNKKGKTELKAVLVKRAGCHFGFFKRAGRHEKGAGRRALQNKPRQNTEFDSRNAAIFSQKTADMCVCSVCCLPSQDGQSAEAQSEYRRLITDHPCPI